MTWIIEDNSQHLQYVLRPARVFVAQTLQEAPIVYEKVGQKAVDIPVGVTAKAGMLITMGYELQCLLFDKDFFTVKLAQEWVEHFENHDVEIRLEPTIVMKPST